MIKDILLIIFLVFFISFCVVVKEQMREQTKALQEIASNIDTQNEIMKGGV